MTHRFDPPFVALPLAVVVAALVDAIHHPEDGVAPDVLQSAFALAPNMQGLPPTYTIREGRWDVNDEVNRQPHETDAAWNARRVAAATHWAAEDKAEQEQAEAAAVTAYDREQKRRLANREAQRRFRNKNKPPDHADDPAVAAAQAEVDRVLHKRRELTNAINLVNKELKVARGNLVLAQVAAEQTLSNGAAAQAA